MTDPLELIAAGRHSVEAVCRESGMSILELAEHVCTAENIAALGRVAQLHAIEREMLLGKLKRDALMRLRELTDEVPAASGDEVRAAEVMRKACVDLLRYGGGTTSNTSPRQTQSLPPEPLTPAFEAEVLEALERLGEVREEEEYPQIEDSRACPPSVVLPPPETLSSFDLQPGEEPGAYASGSLRRNTGEMPVPLEICNGNEASKLSGEDGTRFEDGHPP